MTSSGITVKRGAGSWGVISGTADLGGSDYFVATGVALHLAVSAREDAAVGGIAVALFGVVVE